jgi:hypothetical protein
VAIVRDPLVSVESGLVEIDTTRRSLVHRVSLGGIGESEPAVKSIAKTYLAAALLTYGVMALVAALEWLLGPARPDVKLPFWRDATTAFMFLVAFPTILVLVVTDNAALRAAMRRVQRDGVLTMTAAQEAIIEQRWGATFARLNAVIQIVALVMGAAIMIANYFAYRPETVGFWIASGGRLRPAGYVFLLSVWAFFAVIPIYIARTFAISFLLANVVRAGDIRMLPFHPDKCGGLRPVGSLALRNQYGLSVMGINVVLFALMSILYLDTPQSLFVLIALAVVAYLVVGPIVFMGPLLPFRGGMMRTKSELMSEVAQRLRIELSRIRAELQSGVITREDEELIDRLRKIGAVIDELPVWPFDAGILRRFLTAYVIPLIGAMLYPFASIVFENVFNRLR